MKYLKWIVLSLVLLGLAFLFYNWNPATNSLLPQCVWHKTTGTYCPGCGSQRAFYNVLHFNFSKAIQQNALFVIGGIFVVYNLIIVGINKLFKTSFTNYLNHKKFVLIVIIVALLFFILRNLPIYPFTLLAPS